MFRTAWELPQQVLIDLAVARAPFVDQSQSLNLFMVAPAIGRLSSMYMHPWKSGVKATYYLRSRPATRIQGATVPAVAAVACSLENPETCEPARVTFVTPGALAGRGKHRRVGDMLLRARRKPRGRWSCRAVGVLATLSRWRSRVQIPSGPQRLEPLR